MALTDEQRRIILGKPEYDFSDNPNITQVSKEEANELLRLNGFESVIQEELNFDAVWAEFEDAPKFDGEEMQQLAKDFDKYMKITQRDLLLKHQREHDEREAARLAKSSTTLQTSSTVTKSANSDKQVGKSRVIEPSRVDAGRSSRQQSKKTADPMDVSESPEEESGENPAPGGDDDGEEEEEQEEAMQAWDGTTNPAWGTCVVVQQLKTHMPVIDPEPKEETPQLVAAYGYERVQRHAELKFYIKWKGFPIEEGSWESLSFLNSWELEVDQDVEAIFDDVEAAAQQQGRKLKALRSKRKGEGNLTGQKKRARK